MLRAAIGADALAWVLRMALAPVLIGVLGGDVLGQVTNAPRSTRDEPTAPIVFQGETVATATGHVGAFSAAERARAISERLTVLSESWELDPVDITVLEAPDESAIAIGDRVLMMVTNTDAARAGEARNALAVAYAERFRTAVIQARDRLSLRWILLGSLKTLAATAGLIAGLVLMRTLGRRTVRWLDEVQTRTLRQESVLTVLTHGLSLLLALLLRLFAWPAVVIMLLAYIHFVLGWFPASAPLAKQQHESLMGFLSLALERVVAYLPNLAIIAIIVIATRFLLKVIASVLQGFEDERLRLSGFHPDWATPTYKLIRFGVLALLVVLLYPYLPGSSSEAFRGVSVFLGLLISLGSSSVIANAVAGTVQTYMRALRPGDFVQVGDYTGTVIDKSLLVTRIRTVKNVVITLPNSMTLSTPVLNYSVMGRQVGVILHFEVTVSFDIPWRTVHGLLLAATEHTPGVLDDPRPFINQTMLARTHVAYELNVHTDEPSRQAAIFTALNQNIQDQFHQAGIRIMVPTYVSLMGEETPALENGSLRRSGLDGRVTRE